MNNQSEILTQTLAAVLPRIAVACVVYLLMLGVGVMVLTEGAPLLRSLTATLSQPWRSLVVLAVLAAGLAAAVTAGRVILVAVLTYGQGGPGA